MRYVMVFNDCQDWFEMADGEPVEIWGVDESEFHKIDSGDRAAEIDQVAVWQVIVDEQGETVRLVNEQEQNVVPSV